MSILSVVVVCDLDWAFSIIMKHHRQLKTEEPIFMAPRDYYILQRIFFFMRI